MRGGVNLSGERERIFARILELLEGGGHVSGEHIAAVLGVSRAVVWKHVEALRSFGYGIEATSHRGYRLRRRPDTIRPCAWLAGLGTRRLGRGVIHYDRSLPSTMDTAFTLARAGAPEGSVVCAETQSRGRGRFGRVWSSPPGGIYVSLLLRPTTPLFEVSRVPIAAAVALVETLTVCTGVSPRIKWPNDVLLDGGKVAGILVELSAEMERVHFLVVGVGINVQVAPGRLPVGAVDLATVTGRRWERSALLRRFLEETERMIELLEHGGWASIVGRWRGASATLGRRVRFEDGREIIEGLAEDLASDGGLIVRCDSGRRIRRMAGEVTILSDGDRQGG